MPKAIEIRNWQTNLQGEREIATKEQIQQFFKMQVENNNYRARSFIFAFSQYSSNNYCIPAVAPE